MNRSSEYAHYHTSTFYPRGCHTRKMSATTFKKETMLAHLVGRAFACQKIMDQHKANPYTSIDELLGDLQLELVNCLNDFKKSSGSIMKTVKIEDVIESSKPSEVT